MYKQYYDINSIDFDKEYDFIRGKQYTIVFIFTHENATINYIIDRVCPDLTSMIRYCYDWVIKYGRKYGDFVGLKIYERNNLVYDQYFD